jgi:Ni/Fe-hydrogenase subunit HybB-like protein
MNMKRHHLITAAIIIGIGIVLVAMFLYSQREVKNIAQRCQAKNLEVFELADQQICREPSSGQLYAP